MCFEAPRVVRENFLGPPDLGPVADPAARQKMQQRLDALREAPRIAETGPAAWGPLAASHGKWFWWEFQRNSVG